MYVLRLMLVVVFTSFFLFSHFYQSKLSFIFNSLDVAAFKIVCVFVFVYPPYNLVRIYEFKERKHSIDTNSANSDLAPVASLSIGCSKCTLFAAICIDSVFLLLFFCFLLCVCNIWFHLFVLFFIYGCM